MNNIFSFSGTEPNNESQAAAASLISEHVTCIEIIKATNAIRSMIVPRFHDISGYIKIPMEYAEDVSRMYYHRDRDDAHITIVVSGHGNLVIDTKYTPLGETCDSELQSSAIHMLSTGELLYLIERVCHYLAGDTSLLEIRPLEYRRPMRYKYT